MPLDLDAALRYLVHNDGSDLHLKAGSAPGFRIDGEVQPQTEHGKLPPQP